VNFALAWPKASAGIKITTAKNHLKKFTDIRLADILPAILFKPILLPQN
jgi:hypothetical protein